MLRHGSVRNELLDLRTRQFGSTDWRTVNARVALVHIQRLAGLTPPERRELAEADDLLGASGETIFRAQFPRGNSAGRAMCSDAKRLLGDSDAVYVDALAWSGFLYNAAEDYAKAEPVLLQALDLRKSMLGEDHPDYATGLNNLGFAYAGRGEYAEAASAHRQALAVRRSILGEKHPDCTASANNLLDVLTKGAPSRRSSAKTLPRRAAPERGLGFEEQAIRFVGLADRRRAGSGEAPRSHRAGDPATAARACGSGQLAEASVEIAIRSQIP